MGFSPAQASEPEPTGPSYFARGERAAGLKQAGDNAEAAFRWAQEQKAKSFDPAAGLEHLQELSRTTDDPELLELLRAFGVAPQQ